MNFSQEQISSKGELTASPTVELSKEILFTPAVIFTFCLNVNCGVSSEPYALPTKPRQVSKVEWWEEE